MLRDYQTWEVDEMVSYIETQPGFLVGQFFGRIKTFNTETIEFDVINEGRRIAPFVSPLVQGRVMRDSGSNVMQFKPAYIKLADLFRPTDGFTRRAGETYGGTMSPAQRIDLAVQQVFERHRLGIELRKEWMAAQALIFGSITVSGESYPTSVVDFGRDPALSVTLTGANRWSQTTADPMGNIETVATLVRRKSRGSIVTDLIMNGVTWALFRNLIKTDATLAKLYTVFQNVMPGSNFDLSPRQGKTTAELVGNIAGRFRIWVYDGFYNDDDFAEQPFIPDNKVLFMSSEGVEGTQYYGAILDHEAGIEPREIFTKTWLVKDPSALRILTQAAPLVGPRRPNASAVLTVN